ncbi:YncE family protein [Streptomyces arenae]|uniref:YncE family protein n=1 Tax=Streptomyces arenae TaxID=29301 RepID=UPI00265A0DBA|nr:Ig-like domain repeat protein [Streptomyces arenae]MCG7204330.1 Ig-like domain repeat protein [Streptomyces arenae]
MRSTSIATALAVVLGSAALSVGAAGTASAVPVTVGSNGGIVVDAALGRVFVGNDTDDSVVAADYNGNRVDSVSGIDGVFDLAVSDDGATLYAAARSSHEIVALDAATLDVKARYPVTTSIGPLYLEVAAGKVWFTYQNDDGKADLGSVDPALDPAGGDPVTLGLFPQDQDHSLIAGAARLDTDPSEPGLLAFGTSDYYSGDGIKDLMAVLDVSGAAPRLTAWRGDDHPMYHVNDIDLVPGTAQVLVDGTERHAYADGAFSAAGSYPSGRSADIAPNGLVAQWDEEKVAVYRPDTTVPVRTYAGYVADAAWAPDSSRLFALVSAPAGYQLRVLTDPALSVPALTVAAPASAPRAKKLTVTGKLTASVPFAAGTRLAVTRTDLESPDGKALAAVTVGADGTYSFADTPPAGGTVTYRVSFAGDAGHTAASGSDKVAVSRAATGLSVNNNGKLYNYGTDVKFTAHLGTTYKNRSVKLYADPFGADKPKKLVKTGKVDSHGNIAAWVDMTRDTAVTAVFDGDARYAPKTVKATAYARVKVSTAVSKHYRTAKIGSTSYYWFHKNTDPVLTTSMTYYQGRKYRLDLQVYYQGRWYTTDAEYFALGSNGRSAVRLGAPGESGIRARMRAVYVNGSSGDSVNSTTYGAWKYLYFSN